MDIVNEKWKTLLLGDCMSTLKQNNFQIPLIIGRDLNGKDVVEDLVQISNILVVGTTGTGKRNLLNTFIVDTIYNSNPEEVKMILIDTRIIVLIEDLCELMAYEKEDVEEALIEIVKISRKVGIHLIISTYRTSTEIITGRIKSNIPTRITFKLPSRVDSRTVIDKSGAEKLLPYGDALFIKVEERAPKRIQAPYISDEEIEKIIDEIKVEEKSNSSDEIMKVINKETMKSEDTDCDVDPLLNEAMDEVISTGMVSIQFIQQRFKIGYARAGRIIDQMEEREIISGDNGDKPREVLINKDFGNEQEDVQNQTENEEEKMDVENIKYVYEHGNKSSIFRKWGSEYW